jgi:hypothetical protein
MRASRNILLIATALAVAVPASTALSAAPSADAAAAGILGFGGATHQGWPVMVQLSRNSRRVVQAFIGIDTFCRNGGDYLSYPDDYKDLPVTKGGAFHATYGPTPVRQTDGTIRDFGGSMNGRVNAARTVIKGTWRLTVTLRDATGAVTDVCDSGKVTWTARR